MAELPIDTWQVRDLPVLRAVEALELLAPGPQDVATLSTRSGLRRQEVLDALDVLEGLRAVRVVRAVDGEPRVGNLTAIGSVMLAIQAENDLAS